MVIAAVATPFFWPSSSVDGALLFARRNALPRKRRYPIAPELTAHLPLHRIAGDARPKVAPLPEAPTIPKDALVMDSTQMKLGTTRF